MKGSAISKRKSWSDTLLSVDKQFVGRQRPFSGLSRRTYAATHDVLLVTVSILAASGPVAADVPNYNTFTLHLRSNLCVNKGGAGSPVFNIPCDTFFNSATPVINDEGSVAVSLTLIEAGDFEGVFVSDACGAGIVYTSTAGASVSDVSINNIGDVVFEQVFSSENGLWIYDDSNDTTARETTAPLGASGWSSPEINDSNEIGFCANLAGDYAFVSYSGGSTAIHATEVAIDVNSPYSFLFTPSFNNARQIAGKVRDGGPGQLGGSQPDEIRVFNSDGTSIPIAEDVDGNIASPYTSFDNSVSLTSTGWVAFTVNLGAGGSGVIVSGVLSDLDGNLLVNVFDLLDLLANWNTNGSGADIAAPLDTVVVFNLLVLLSEWSS